MKDQEPPDRRTGWPSQSYSSLAELLGNHDGLAIYRRFATLNAQNLLYLQSELIILEDELKRLAFADDSSESEQRRTFKNDIRALKADPSNEVEGRQWRKVLEIREKLKEYNDALLQHSRLYKLPKANSHDLHILREWYNNEDKGNIFMEIPEGNAWNEDMTDDLVGLSALKSEGDIFTKWIREKLIQRYNRWIGYRLKEIDEQTGLYHYKDTNINRAVDTISIVLSSLLPPASIFALYYVHRTPVRLGLIMVFSALLAGCLAIFTNAKRVEIFAVTVALASVQVVFIGTSGNSIP